MELVQRSMPLQGLISSFPCSHLPQIKLGVRWLLASHAMWKNALYQWRPNFAWSPVQLGRQSLASHHPSSDASSGAVACPVLSQVNWGEKGLDFRVGDGRPGQVKGRGLASTHQSSFTL